MNFAAFTDPVTPEYLRDVLGWNDISFSELSSEFSEDGASLVYSRHNGGDRLRICVRLSSVEIPAPPTVGHLLALCWGFQIPIPEGVCK